MKKIYSLIGFLCFAFLSVEAQEYMQITTIESVIPGGMGRSRMFITNPDGSVLEKDNLKNFFSMTGINLKNVKNNEEQIVLILNEFLKAGWKVHKVSTGSFSGKEGGGIFITRYLLYKE